jgi:hypothetical protein
VEFHVARTLRAVFEVVERTLIRVRHPGSFFSERAGDGNFEGLIAGFGGSFSTITKIQGFFRGIFELYSQLRV